MCCEFMLGNFLNPCFVSHVGNINVWSNFIPCTVLSLNVTTSFTCSRPVPTLVHMLFLLKEKLQILQDIALYNRVILKGSPRLLLRPHLLALNVGMSKHKRKLNSNIHFTSTFRGPPPLPTPPWTKLRSRLTVTPLIMFTIPTGSKQKGLGVAGRLQTRRHRRPSRRWGASVLWLSSPGPESW